MQIKCALALCVWLVAGNAAACNLTTGTTPFMTSGVSSAGEDAGLKPPELELVEVTRGVDGRASCDASGLLTLSVAWPRGTDYKLRDLGFEFRVVGEDSLAIFPGEPLSGRVDGRRSEFVFLWRDGPPASQARIDMVVEVRAVTADNRRGPPAQVRVVSAPGG
ncbi:hypothetical protein J2X02_003104 [Pseudoxanthomonas japonensis]|uniref:hypothetical protein n=1 Tax=Pseudoxanthomonas japonensis TaxID=69284 RepID=UPI001D5792DF|nr:hypothetical protein [Pseudoxanthomonas japonensis]MBA3931077.1 hypothetical protein [Xanthomonas sp.]MDR7070239.1 hypothetical protein [Pseudoxanthomonas japonensis]